MMDGSEMWSQVLGPQETDPSARLSQLLGLVATRAGDLPGDPELQTRLLHSLADCARHEECRTTLVAANFQLADVLGAGDEYLLSRTSLVVETCRLFGNICFNNPLGRAMVVDQNIVAQIDRSFIHLDAITEDEGDSDPKLRSDGILLLRVLPAFLQNFTIDNPDCIQVLVTDITHHLAAKIASIDVSSLPASDTSLEDVLQPTMDYFVSLSETPAGQRVLQEDRCSHVAACFALYLTLDSPRPEVLAAILELATTSCAIRQGLRSQESHYLCIRKIESKSWTDDTISTDPEDEEDDCQGPTLLKFGCDLLALLIVDDDNDSIRSGSQGRGGGGGDVGRVLTDELFKTFALWLGADNEPDLVTTATLVFGNYCQSDAHCSHLVVAADGQIVPLLVRLLAPTLSGIQPRRREILHGTVGCLRNLSVCRDVRPRLLAGGVVEACVGLIVDDLSTAAPTTDISVVGKTVSMLRLLSQEDKDLSTALGTNCQLVAAVCRLAASGILGNLVTEIARLLSSVVRYSKSSTVSEIVVNDASRTALPLLLSLLRSDHPQLVNESLVPLAFITAAKLPVPASLVEQLDMAFLVERLAVLLGAASVMPTEVKSNGVQLVANLLDWNMTGIIEYLSVQSLRTSLDQFNESLSPGTPGKELVTRTRERIH